MERVTYQLLSDGLPQDVVRSLVEQWRTSVELGTATALMLAEEYRRLGRPSKPAKPDACRVGDVLRGATASTPPDDSFNELAESCFSGKPLDGVETIRSPAWNQTPRKGRRNNPPEYRTRTVGRGPTPWGWFRKAGFEIELLTPLERWMVSSVYRVLDLKLGWSSKRTVYGNPVDGGAETREWIPFPPHRVIARFRKATGQRIHPETVRRARRNLIACELHRCKRERGGDVSVRSGWFHGLDAEEENLAALRRCAALFLERVRSRPPRPGGYGKPRRRRPSVGGTVVGTVEGTVVGTVEGPPYTPEPDNPLEAQELRAQECTLSAEDLKREERRKKNSQERCSALSQEQEHLGGEHAPTAGDDSATPVIDWKELRRLVRPKQTADRKGDS